MKLLLWVWLAAGSPNAGLSSAEEAYRAGRYDLVRPRVEHALATPLTDAERRRAYELLTIAASAFDDAASAVEAFRQLLRLDPHYTPADGASPKLRHFFEQAQRSAAAEESPSAAAPPAPPLPPELVPAPAAPPPVEVIAPAPTEKTQRPLYERPWPYVVLGAALVAAGVGIAYAVATAPPGGDLPNGHLR
jgi:hypothetical protein